MRKLILLAVVVSCGCATNRDTRSVVPRPERLLIIPPGSSQPLPAKARGGAILGPPEAAPESKPADLPPPAPKAEPKPFFTRPELVA